MVRKSVTLVPDDGDDDGDPMPTFITEGDDILTLMLNSLARENQRIHELTDHHPEAEAILIGRLVAVVWALAYDFYPQGLHDITKICIAQLTKKGRDSPRAAIRQLHAELFHEIEEDDDAA